MSQFLLESLRRYKERVRADRRFQTDLTRVRRLAEHSRIASDEFFLCLLTPLIEVSWVDGSIGRYEQDAILRAGDRYGLFTKDENFYVLMERLSARPTAGEYGALWSEIFERLRTVRLPATAAIASHLLEQTKYVAGLGQKQVVGFSPRASSRSRRTRGSAIDRAAAGRPRDQLLILRHRRLI